MSIKVKYTRGIETNYATCNTEKEYERFKKRKEKWVIQ